MSCDDSGQAAGKAFSGPGTRQGGPSAMSSEMRSGALTDTEITESRDPGRPAGGGNRVPNVGLRREGAL